MTRFCKENIDKFLTGYTGKDRIPYSAFMEFASDMYDTILSELRSEREYEVRAVAISVSYGRDSDSGRYLGAEKYTEIKIVRPYYRNGNLVWLEPDESDLHPRLYAAMKEYSRWHVGSTEADQTVAEIVVDAATR